MCGKGSQTTTQQTQQTQTPNPQALGAYNNVLNQAQNVAATPYQPYPGQLVAPVNAQQQAGIANINQYQPAYNTALGMAYGAAQPITAQQISQYESPYTQQVVNATQAQFNNQNAQQQQQVLGNAVAQGALGGNRVGIAQSELANQQQLAQAPVIANLENQGYNTGLNTALTEQQAMQQGAFGVANMANAGLSGANAQIGAGTLQQQTQQAQDQAAYQQFLNQMGYPFQTTQWLAGLDTGVGSQMGGTTTGQGSTTAPPPSMLGQMAGLGSLLTGLAGSGGLLSFLSRGGGVGNFASGGGVAQPDLPPTIPETRETLHAQQKQLIDGDRDAQMFPHGTPELPLPQGMKRTPSHSGVFHHNDKVSEDQIHQHSRDGNEHLLLGLGPYSKNEIMHRIASGEHPVAVVERNKHGHEVRAALGTHNTAAVQHEHMQRVKSKDHTLHLEHPHAVLGARLRLHRQSGGAVSSLQLSGMPYSSGVSYIPSNTITPGHTLPPGMQPPPVAGTAQQQSNPSNLSAGLGHTTQGGTNNLKDFYNELQSGESVQGALAPNDTSYNPSNDDEYGMEEWESRGGRVGVANRRADGGKVLQFPSNAARNGIMSLDDYADGLNKMMTRDTLSRALGGINNVTPLQPTPGGQPKASGGGVANRDTGGDIGAPLDDPSWDDTHQADPVPSVPQDVMHPAPSEDEALAWGPAKDTGVAAPAVAPSTPPPAPPPTPAPKEDTGVAAPRGIRNNNPGNIEDGPFARTQPGYVGSDGRFAVFDNMDNGKAATTSLLGSYGNKGINTISGIVNRWAPAADGNNTNAYISAVAKQTGLDPHAPLDMKDPALMGKIADAIHMHENGQPVGYSNRLEAQNYNRSYGALDIPKEYQATARDQSPNGIANFRPDIDFSSEGKLWPSLITAGAAAMASRSPFPGVAIGEAAGAGAQTYMGLKLNDQQMQMKAQQLSQQASHWEREDQRAKLAQGESERHNKAEEARQAQETAIKASEPKPFYEQGVGMNYISRTPEGDVVLLGGPNAGKIIAGPHAGQMQQQQPAAPAVQPGVNAPAAPTSQQVNPPGTPQTAQQQPQKNVQVASLDPSIVGSVVAAANRAKTPYNYLDTEHLPVIEKGMDVPDPTPTNGVSADVMKSAASYYLSTGQLPQSLNISRGASPMAQSQSDTAKAIRNYAMAMAASKGYTADQVSDMWRTSKNMAKYLGGKDADQTVSLGTAVRHLQTVQELADAWKEAGNGNFAPLNALKAKVQTMFGKDAVTNLEAAGHIVGPEIIKAIGVAGAGTSDERAGAAAGFMGSPDQIRGAIKTIQHLLLGQLVGKENKARENGVSEEQFKGLIGGDSYDYLKKLEAVGSSLTGNKPAAGAATPTQSAAPVQQPPVPGAKLYQGKWYTRGPDGKPVEVQQ